MSYVRALQQLLPAGAAWAKSTTSNFYQLVESLAAEPQRVDDTIALLLAESTLSTVTTDETLTHWETLSGITEIADTIAGRRSVIRARLLGYADPNQQFSQQTYIDIAAGMGYSLTFTKLLPFRVGVSAIGSPLASDDWVSTVIINTTTVLDAGVNHYPTFRVDHSAVGDPVSDPSWYGYSTHNAAFEAALRAITASHVRLIFNYL